MAASHDARGAHTMYHSVIAGKADYMIGADGSPGGCWSHLGALPLLWRNDIKAGGIAKQGALEIR